MNSTGNNDDISFALDYHEGTKHSEISVRTSGHYLDWDSKPFPFKIYEGLPSSPLPRDFAPPTIDALQSVSSVHPRARSVTLGAEELAELLFFSGGITRKLHYGGDILYMRAASATGALYPIELYVVCGEIRGLRAGVYHFNPLEFTLIRLREGDHRAELAAASSESSVRTAPMTIVFTSFAWRNAWKYQGRSYRHWFWDAGVIVANLLSLAYAIGLEARVVAGFVDSAVDALLGMEDGKEATVLLVVLRVGRRGESAPATVRKLKPIKLKSKPLSPSEVEYPEIWKMNRASSLQSPADVGHWRSVEYASGNEEGHDDSFPLKPGRPPEPGATLGDVILRRGSTRRFAIAPVEFSQLSSILRASKAEVPFDCLPSQESLIETYLIANSVEGLPPGSYFFDSKREALIQLKSGELRRMSAYLCLEQPLFGYSSVVFFLMSPLGRVLRAYGNRGYRVAQLEGGIRAGKIYLAAYSQGLGASGSTFYDDAVTDFFSPHAEGKAAVIVVGVGVPAYKAKKGTVLPQFS